MVKKLLPSIILLLVLVAGMGYAYSQHFFQKKDETTSAETKLLTVSTNELQQIVIHPSALGTGDDTANSNAEASTSGTSDKANSTADVTLVHDNNQWTIAQPGAYPANTYMIEDWLSTLESATVHGTVEQSPQDVSRYGMEQGQPGIVLTTKDGQKLEISFGSETPEREYDYARVNDGPIIQVAGQTINDLAGATAFHFIDTTPFGWDDQQLSKLVWKGNTPTTTWTLTHQLSSGGDPNQDKWSLNDHSITPSEAGSITDAIKNIPTDELPVAADKVKGYKHVLTLEIQLMATNGDDNTGSEATSSQSQYTGWQAADDATHIWIVEPTGKWAYRLPADSISRAAKTAADVLSGKSD